MSDERTVPFGKYKGRPVSEMIADTNYYNWLQNQSWFKNNLEQTKFPIKDSPTPKHNHLQISFLEMNVVLKFLEQIGVEGKVKDISVVFEAKYGWDVVISYNLLRGDTIWEDGKEKTFEISIPQKIYVELKTMVGDEYACILRKLVKQKEDDKDENGQYILVIQSYNGETPWESVQKFFKTQNIVVINTDFLQ